MSINKYFFLFYLKFSYNCCYLQVTKCSFQKFGASGTIERLDGLCVLPINIINEKVPYKTDKTYLPIMFSSPSVVYRYLTVTILSSVADLHHFNAVSVGVFTLMFRS